MVIRQARLIALLLIGTVTVLALASVIWFGPDAAFLSIRGAGDAARRTLSTREAALGCIGYAAVLGLIFDRASRVRRWRRNIVRAGTVFATSWIGILALIVMAQMIAWAQALGHPIARESAFAVAVALFALLKANYLPKSRPAWLNGTTLPLFAPQPSVWRRVHRASALRLCAIACGILFCLAALSPGPGLRSAVIWLLAIEVGLATLHGLWLSGPPWSRRTPA